MDTQGRRIDHALCLDQRQQAGVDGAVVDAVGKDVDPRRNDGAGDTSLGGVGHYPCTAGMGFLDSGPHPTHLGFDVGAWKDEPDLD